MHFKVCLFFNYFFFWCFFSFFKNIDTKFFIKLKYQDYLVPFELLFVDLKKSYDFESDDLEFTKTRLKETCLSSFRFYNQKKHDYENISKDEFKALSELIELKNLVIQKEKLFLLKMVKMLKSKNNGLIMVQMKVFHG